METETVHVVMVQCGDHEYPLMVWATAEAAEDQAKDEGGRVIEVPMIRPRRRRARARRIPA